jgi:hypothetical protein
MGASYSKIQAKTSYPNQVAITSNWTELNLICRALSVRGGLPMPLTMRRMQFGED